MNLAGTKTRLIVDARCLQDPGLVERGIGQYTASLLAAPRARQARDLLDLIALTDPSLPALAPAHRALFQSEQAHGYVPNGPPLLFLSLSPMTHDPLATARLLQQSHVTAAAIVHDFIPHDFPERYLAVPQVRLRYRAQLAWLGRYHAYFANSETTARRIGDFRAFSATPTVVTGIPVRPTLLTDTEPTAWAATDPRMLVVGGQDWRKNVEIVLRAHSGSVQLQRARIVLQVIGNYDRTMRQHLLDFYGTFGGDPSLVEFASHLPDSDLRTAYAKARLTVAPSRVEGFSIPIVEAAANGCPVIASHCDAQRELLPNPEDLFDPDDVERLRWLAERAALDPQAHGERRARQSDVWRRFTLDRVADRFWDALLRLAPRSAPAIGRRHRPRLAFITPMPPAPSGCAEYSSATLGTLRHHVDIDVYTDTPAPALPPGVRLAGSTQRIAHLDGRYDAVVSVIGNSHFHRHEFDLLLENGAAAIAHDARMLNFYDHLLGRPRTRAAAEAELGRPVSDGEINHWLAQPRDLPAVFLGDIAKAAKPMIVHSPITASLVRERFGVPCAWLPFVPYRTIEEREIVPAARAAARAALGVAPEELVVATFGGVNTDRAPDELVWATEMLRSWGYIARLVFVGSAEAPIAAWIRDVARSAGITASVTVDTAAVDEERYRAWLAAADVAVQLRTYKLGGLSGALLDCIAAGLPTIANDHLAQAMDAPSYVIRVPDALSAVLVAEAIADLVDQGRPLNRPIELRRDVLAARNFEIYARRLIEAVGLA